MCKSPPGVLRGLDSGSGSSKIGALLKYLQKAILNKEENIKDHIKTKNQTLSEQLMKKWFKKGDK